MNEYLCSVTLCESVLWQAGSSKSLSRLVQDSCHCPASAVTLCRLFVDCGNVFHVNVRLVVGPPDVAHHDEATLDCPERRTRPFSDP